MAFAVKVERALQMISRQAMLTLVMERSADHHVGFGAGLRDVLLLRQAQQAPPDLERLVQFPA